MRTRRHIEGLLVVAATQPGEGGNRYDFASRSMTAGPRFDFNTKRVFCVLMQATHD